MKKLRVLLVCIAILFASGNVYCSVNPDSTGILSESQNYAIFNCSAYNSIYVINKNNKTVSDLIDASYAVRSFEYKGYFYFEAHPYGGIGEATAREMFKVSSNDFKLVAESSGDLWTEGETYFDGKIIGFDENNNLIINDKLSKSGTDLYSLDANLKATEISSYDASKITPVNVSDVEEDDGSAVASEVYATDAKNSLGFVINDTKYNRKYTNCYNDSSYTDNLAYNLYNKTCDFIGANSQNIYYACSYNWMSSLLKSKELKSIFNKEASQIISIIKIDRKTGKQSLVRILGRDISYNAGAGVVVVDGELVDGQQMQYVSKIHVTVAKFGKYSITREGIFYNNKKLVSANYIMKPTHKNNIIYYYDYDGINVRYNKYDIHKNKVITVKKYSVAQDLTKR